MEQSTDQPQAQPSRRRLVLRVVVPIAVVAVAAVLGIVGKGVVDRLISTGLNNTAAAVGDCMRGSTASSLKIVKCTDAGAQYKVVGKITNKSQADFTSAGARICAQFAGATSAYWRGERGGKGYVLCLAPAR